MSCYLHLQREREKEREGERERVRVHGINDGHVATGKSSSMAKYNYGNCSE